MEAIIVADKNYFGKTRLKAGGKDAKDKNGNPIYKVNMASKTLPNGTKVPGGTRTIIGKQAIARRKAYEAAWDASREKSIKKAVDAGFDPFNDSKALGNMRKQAAAGGAKVAGVSDAQRRALNAGKAANNAAYVAKKTGKATPNNLSVAERKAYNSAVKAGKSSYTNPVTGKSVKI